jgi:hypothetical protein
MKYRRLDNNYEPCFGRGKLDYLEDRVENPDAIAQAIKTRLLGFIGEWWMDVNDGLPLWQQILGQRAKTSVIEGILVDRIKGLIMPDSTYAITSVSQVTSDYDPETRAYSFSCYVDTVYGKLYITNSQGVT